jgi:hypothetical protein
MKRPCPVQGSRWILSLCGNNFSNRTTPFAIQRVFSVMTYWVNSEKVWLGKFGLVNIILCFVMFGTVRIG